MTYEIIENFLPADEFDSLVKTVCDGHFPWFASGSGIAYPEDGSVDKYFTHTFYIEHAPNSEYYTRIIPILYKLGVKAVIRARANLYARTELLTEHPKHVDFPFQHKAFILYLNTNNGFTRLDNGIAIQSIANRALLFDGSKEHNSSNCTDTPCRLNVSINYF